MQPTPRGRALMVEEIHPANGNKFLALEEITEETWNALMRNYRLIHDLKMPPARL